MTKKEVLAILGCYVMINRTRVRPPMSWQVAVYGGGGDPIPSKETLPMLSYETAQKVAKEIAEKYDLLFLTGDLLLELRDARRKLEKEFHESSEEPMWEDFLKAKASHIAR